MKRKHINILLYIVLFLTSCQNFALHNPDERQIAVYATLHKLLYVLEKNGEDFIDIYTNLFRKFETPIKGVNDASKKINIYIKEIDTKIINIKWTSISIFKDMFFVYGVNKDHIIILYCIKDEYNIFSHIINLSEYQITAEEWITKTCEQFYNYKKGGWVKFKHLDKTYKKNIESIEDARQALGWYKKDDILKDISWSSVKCFNQMYYIVNESEPRGIMILYCFKNKNQIHYFHNVKLDMFNMDNKVIQEYNVKPFKKKLFSDDFKLRLINNIKKKKKENPVNLLDIEEVDSPLVLWNIDSLTPLFFEYNSNNNKIINNKEEAEEAFNVYIKNDPYMICQKVKWGPVEEKNGIFFKPTLTNISPVMLGLLAVKEKKEVVFMWSPPLNF